MAAVSGSTRTLSLPMTCTCCDHDDDDGGDGGQDDRVDDNLRQTFPVKGKVYPNGYFYSN